MLSAAAFNAFLKTLEEPPPNTTFILATTDPDKLPETIASRCQRFDFRRIPRDGMVAHMRRVADREEIAIDDDVLEIVARRATGSLRDGLSLIDMLATAAGEHADGRIDLALARRMLGMTDDGQSSPRIAKHGSGDVSGMGALLREVNVLCADGEIGHGAYCAFDEDRRQAKSHVHVGKGARPFCDSANFRNIGGKAVHLPITHDIFAARHLKPLLMWWRP